LCQSRPNAPQQKSTRYSIASSAMASAGETEKWAKVVKFSGAKPD